MKILLTGHTGFIGTNLINKFSHTYSFVTLDPIDRARINVLNRDQLNELEKVDAIIHLAAKTSISNSITNPYDVYYTNLVGTLNILDYAKNKGVKNIINLSTFVYGNPKYMPIDESHPVDPHAPYNKSKYLSEKLSEYYSKDDDINVVTLRPFNIYGPGQKSSFISVAIQKIFKGEIVKISSQDTHRDFIFIDDFLDLIAKILNDFPNGYNVYNLGSGKSYSLENILEIIKTITNVKINVEYDPNIRPNDILEMVADIEKVKKRFRWEPKTGIQEGLALTINSYSKNRFKSQKN
ncbi:NAD-dependent epimerase/dehydratase family protein [Candidatus Nitrosocosmicus hydrocola]|uniref:NAD-dependent epimerase/dehydratase family protein n=1 Tax=Candidatus Nitrosocosmicus hydrocola TaxID=1826872 RepID=UPI0011E5EABA|nr:NAD-dependent epimerase/dehydratase family protein [Candidatus Nitrosocosmicus hydrocola]